MTTVFGTSLLPVICRRAHVLFVAFVYSDVQHLILSYVLRSEFRVVLSTTISAWQLCSVRLYLQLFVGGLMTYLYVFFMFVYIGVQYFVLLYIFLFSVSCYDVHYNFLIKTVFGASLHPHLFVGGPMSCSYYLWLFSYCDVQFALTVWVAWRVLYKRQDPLTLREHLGSSLVYSEVRVARLCSFRCCAFCFVFLRPVSFVPSVASFCGLSILDSPFGFR